jgi:hypothetical protein
MSAPKHTPEPATPHTAEEATPKELWTGGLRLLVMLSALGFLLVPIIRELPLGQTTRTAVLAWLLVALALYWLYAGLGYQPLLILQLLIFSAAAALLSAKIVLVALSIERLSVLRRVARALILVGAAFGGLNLLGMAWALVRRRRPLQLVP